MPSVQDVIFHCQRQIKKEPPDEKLLHYLGRLDRLRITIQDLMDTHIGRTVNQLSRYNGDVGHRARKLVKKWKALVKEDNSGESEDSERSSSESEDDQPEQYPTEETPQVKETNENGRLSDQDAYSPTHYDNRDEEEESDSSDRLCIADQHSDKNTTYENEQYRISEEEYNCFPNNSGSDSHDHEENYSPLISKSYNYDNGRSSSYDINSNQFIKQERLSESESDEEDRNHSSPLVQTSKHHRDKHKAEDSNSVERRKGHDRHKSKDQKIRQTDNSASEKQKHHKEKHKKEKSRSRSKEKYKKEGKKRKKDTEDYEDLKPKRSKTNDSESSRKPSKSDRDNDREATEKHRERKEHKKHRHKDKEFPSRSKSTERSNEKLDEKRNDVRKSKSSPDTKSKSNTSRPKSSSKIIPLEHEIDSTSGVGFEELLGSLDQPNVRKHNSDKTKEKPKKPSSSNLNQSHVKPNSSKSTSSDRKPKETEKKKHLESIIEPTLNISPNYKPSTSVVLSRQLMAPKPVVPNSEILDALESESTANSRNSAASKHYYNHEDTLSSMMSSRSQKTKVFSGRSVAYKGNIPKLFDLCMQVIQENIQDLGYTGGVPYDILKPALERANSEQLLQIEEFNPYLIGDTDDLWKFHCNKDFRGKQPNEFESWRELYVRSTIERDEKLAIVRKKMLKKVEETEPVRKAKLAYVEPIGGPRFNRSKATTIKNGMKTLKIKEEKGPAKGVGTSASSGFNNPTDSSKIVTESAVLINPDSKPGTAPAPPVSRESTAKVKPRKAPLMAKTMKLIKTLQRR